MMYNAIMFSRHVNIMDFLIIFLTRCAYCLLRIYLLFYFKNTVGEASTTILFFEIISTQTYVPGDLNLGGRLLHPLPLPSEVGSLLIFIKISSLDSLYNKIMIKENTNISPNRDYGLVWFNGKGKK